MVTTDRVTTDLATSADAPVLARTTPIPLLLERIAAASPTAVATEDPAGTLTYAQLAGRVNRLANRLVEAGVGVGDRVGLMMRHTSDLLVAALAVMRAGGIYVPIDPGYPDTRKAYLASDAGIVLLVTDRAGVAMPSGLSVPTIQPDQGSAAQCVRAHCVDPDDLSCVVYTSGSTGEPKGVMITHRGLSNLAFAADAEFALRPADRFLMLAAAAFSASLEELFPPMVSGATCVFPPDRAALSSVRALLDFVESKAITLLELQPHQWHVLVSHVLQTQGALPPSLRLLIVGGDRVLPPAARQWDRLGIPLVHVYGPTEATATATYWTVPAGGMPPDGILSIGTPIPGTRLYVVDPELRPVEPGKPGELLVGGDCLARGYLGRPAATAEKFIADPLADIDGGLLYRTGDLVRELPDGRLQFIDRIDQQVKVRGYRIEPTEVEAALHEHPAVRHALVLPREDTPGERRLVSYVVADAGALTPSSLRRFLEERLPAHMVPSAFVRLDEFPLNVHRKVDRAALPAPLPHRPDLATEFVPPADALELAICALAADLLGVDEVGALDDFLELGGDSLFLMRLISNIEVRYGAHIGFREASEDRTARGLAAKVRRSSGPGPRP